MANRNFLIALLVAGACLSSLAVSAFFFVQNHTSKGAPAGEFVQIGQGEGVREIAGTLEAHHLIASKTLFELYAFLSGQAHLLKPGTYTLIPGTGVAEIISELVTGPSREAEVTIPEGSNIWDIDELLSSAGVIKRGSFIALQKDFPKEFEGYLFPDTYRFFKDSDANEVAKKMMQNFDIKARPVLEKGSISVRSGEMDKNIFASHLILSSLLEKEVPDSLDRRIVAGILLKRLKAGMPLQVDATICYLKLKRGQGDVSYGQETCYPLTALDLKIDSPYNTYLHRGLPLAPINNPGLDAIQAAMEPTETPYWYYLSDPKTKQTIFSKTLDEHRENRVKYIGVKN